MAYFYRLVAAVLLALCGAMIWLPAHAAFPATSDPTVCTVSPCYLWRATPTASASLPTYFSTKTEACSAHVGSFTHATLYASTPVVYPSVCNYQLYYKSNNALYGQSSSNWQSQETSPQSSYSCPSNSTLSGSSCTCTAPNIENSTQTGCVAPPTADEQACKNFQTIENSTLGVVRESVTISGQHSSGSTICVPTPGPTPGVSIGCTVNFDREISTTNAAGEWTSSGTIDTQNGFPTVPCSLIPSTTDPTLPPVADPNKCPSGQQMGQINGVDSCQPYGTGTTTTTNKDSSDSTTDQNGTTETVKDSVTVCVNGKCTTTETTTTTNTPAGSSTSTTTSSSTSKTEGKDEFCKANPTSPECDSTGAGGTDDGKCRPGDNTVGCTELGGIPGATAVSNVNKPMSITKDTGWGASNGSCPPPQVLNLAMVGTIEIPWDLFCQFAEGIRPIVIGIAYLTAAFTFFGIGRKS